MRQWIPEEIDLDGSAVYAGVRWGGTDGGVAIGMVVGIDGGVTIKGTSGALGGDGDAVAFRALRAAADVIIVGAGTVKAESYGPVVRRDLEASRRAARGQLEVARLAVVTGSLSVAPGDRIFEDPTNPPIIVTTSSVDPDRVASLRSAGADVLQLGGQAVDLAAAIAALSSMGLPRVLCEGGPGLNASMLAAGLVDDLFVTLAPVVTGSAVHMLGGELALPVDLDLQGVIRAGSELLLHYSVAR